MLPTDDKDAARPAATEAGRERVRDPDAQPVHEEPASEEEVIDETIDDSFPASDPPPMTVSRAGAPKRKPEDSEPPTGGA